jgi:hypothetical protein
MNHHHNTIFHAFFIASANFSSISISVSSAKIISNQITRAQYLFKFLIIFIYLSLERGNLHNLFTVCSSIHTTIISLDTFKFLDTYSEYNLSDKLLSIFTNVIEKI